jgi:polar amino acid transport system permease protein
MINETPPSTSQPRRVNIFQVPGWKKAWGKRLENFPWWVILLFFLGALYANAVVSSETYQDAFYSILPGVATTIKVTLISFGLCLVIGFVTGLARHSRNVVLRNIASFYVEVVRGIPMLVQVIYIAFVLVPIYVDVVNGLGNYFLAHVTWKPLLDAATSLANLNIREISMTTRAIAGLAFGFGAYEAEVFRAGIESIEKGQMEAARSLGLTYGKAMRYVILPQAIRTILPPLGNDFISMLKSSSLVSVLAVEELTQLGRIYRSNTFRSYEPWNTVSILYLVMTLSLAALISLLERKMRFEK